MSIAKAEWQREVMFRARVADYPGYSALTFTTEAKNVETQSRTPCRQSLSNYHNQNDSGRRLLGLHRAASRLEC